MKVETREEIKKQTVYVAEDGIEFNVEWACIEHDCLLTIQTIKACYIVSPLYPMHLEAYYPKTQKELDALIGYFNPYSKVTTVGEWIIIITDAEGGNTDLLLLSEFKKRVDNVVKKLESSLEKE